ncbi:MAG: RecX family transcriptional regulator [Anaerolineales bacterium]
MTNTITEITEQKRNPNRVSIYLDGEFAFPLARIVAAWLTVGQTLSPEKIEDLKRQDEFETALQKAIDFIDYRPRTQAEVERKLRKAEIPQGTTAAIIERLTTSNLLNDRDFAQRWVEDRAEFKPRGAYALRAELKQKGIAQEIIDETLSGLDEVSLARAAAEKKAAQLAGLPWPEFRTKLSAHLFRRGFQYELISDVCRQMWDALKQTTFKL